ncbi:hypothetical protein INT48_000901 [Thamnidium elegans]|uniref:Uncharacterized protein n=1 Tax=Thamnidium elegans TaxID=101142 RepID=A0A8H7VRP9_9FUNG|nr:hypothetical protein INT48_000901 [Thamnidium elegans]
MIDGAMENRFKADLNGWLEHESKYPSAVDSNKKDRLHENFEQTMILFGNTEQAHEALHHVIFQALVNQKGTFENGLDYKDYADLVQSYKLRKFMERELWKMDTNSALQLLFELYQNTDQRPLTVLKTFIHLSLNLSDDKQYTVWTVSWTEKVDKFISPSNLHILVQAFYEFISNTFRVSRSQNTQTRVKRLFGSLHNLINAVPSQHDTRVFNILYAIVELAKENEVPEARIIESCYTRFINHLPTTKINLFDYDIEADLTSNQPVSPQISLIEYLKSSVKDPENSDHEHVFKIILEYINLEVFPGQHDNHSVICNQEKPGFDKLEEMVIQNNTETMTVVKLNCIYTIRNRGMYWKSILKVIIQFMDLWISDIIDAKCEEIITELIVKENMLPVLYKHILKHVKHYNREDNSTSLETIKKISQLLEICLNHIQTNQELLLFRDHVFDNRYENNCIRSPILGSTLFWNIPFEQNMVKVTNQITSFEEDSLVPEDVVRKLIILSIVWPYEVVRQLFLTCIQNKNQYKAIVPILISLGKLCTLADRTNGQDTLLVSVLKDTISSENSDLVAKYMGNITHFIKSCCHQKEFNSEYPLILTPNSLVDQGLLSIKDALTHCVLQNFILFSKNNSDSHLVLIQFALYVLSAFCDAPSTNDWTTIMSKSGFPAFLYGSPETYLVCLTKLLKLRLLDNLQPVVLRLQDWESALHVIKRLSIILDYVMETHCKKFPSVYQFLKDTLLEFDWETQLLWYNVTYRIIKRPLQVPMAFFHITGGLNNLFIQESNDAMQTSEKLEGWFQVFTACKLSTKLTDELFEHIDKWMYNLLLLWNHPYEDTIVRACLEHVLHPKTSLSVSIEYPDLLLHFLGKLYDSYTDVHKVIREYNGYEKEEMVPIIQDLSEVVKLLQNFTNWASISRASTSYNELKSKMKTDTISDLVETQNSLSTIDTKSKVIYYPLVDTQDLKSNRALSVITFYHLCSIIQDKTLDEVQQQAIERLMIQITEGLIDMPSRQHFQRMLQQQPKSRIVHWKKKKSDNKFVMLMRPALMSNEEKLLSSVVLDSVPSYKRMAEALGLNVSNKEEESNLKKPQFLYFLN